MRELRRRNRLLEQEVEVLRRATAYLSQAHLPGKVLPARERARLATASRSRSRTRTVVDKIWVHTSLGNPVQAGMSSRGVPSSSPNPVTISGANRQNPSSAPE
jgi:hypothetical protein